MKKLSVGFLLVVLLTFGISSLALADGTETLGPPSIAIASGTGMVAAGTGMEAQPGTIDINVPGTVQQVLLYWSGGMVGNVAGDDTITVDGNAVTGTLIGGPTFFFARSGAQLWFSSYRADITALNLVNPGANSLSVSDMAFDALETNGAGVLVIFDDGSDPVEIDVRDGLDLAFINFPEPRLSTIAQTFNFTPADVDRTASLPMFFGSVSKDGFRPNSIEVTVGGTTTIFSDLLASNDGKEWDTLNLSVDIPAGADSLTVQAFSRDDNGTGSLPASFSWIAAGLAITPPPPPPPGGEGCTPGYWKNHLEDWPPTGYSPADIFDTVFGTSYFDSTYTLGEAIDAKGGGVKKIARHGTAGLLSAAHPDVSYPYTVAEVIAYVQSGNVDDLVDANELGCEIP